MVLNLSSVVSMNGKHYDYIYCVEACYFDKTRKHYYTSIQDVKRYFNRYKDSDNLIYINFYKYDVVKIIDVDFKENLAFLLFKAEQKQIDAFVTGYNRYGWTKGDLSSLEEVEQQEKEEEVEQQEKEVVLQKPEKNNTVKNNHVLSDMFIVNDTHIYDNINDALDDSASEKSLSYYSLPYWTTGHGVQHINKKRWIHHGYLLVADNELVAFEINNDNPKRARHDITLLRQLVFFTRRLKAGKSVKNEIRADYNKRSARND